MRRGIPRRQPVLAMVCSSLMAAGLAACTSSSPASPPAHVSGGPSGTRLAASGIHKIKHAIIVMQENRSFDSYFGTFPGADGIAMANGTPVACVPNPAGGCTRPYHDTADVNGGGPHGEVNAVADVDGGRMDGFIAQHDKARPACAGCTTPPPAG
jgi:phospholipase C